MVAVLSVDYDFWVPLEWSYDWGHAESLFFIENLWPLRASEFLARGIDLRTEIAVCEEDCHPTDLCHLLENEIDCRFLAGTWGVSDSHLAAHAHFSDLKKNNLHIVHLDAHHDFGYNSEQLDCSNWVKHLVQDGKVSRITLVYPTWRKDEERYGTDWYEGTDETVDKWRKQGIDVTVGYGIQAIPKQLLFESAFLCRSGAWVPPWLDDTFIDMANELILGTGPFAVYYHEVPANLESLRRKLDWSGVETSAQALKAGFDAIERIQSKRRQEA